MAEDGGPSTADGWKSKRFRYNAVVQPLLTDLYQITMAYAYWKAGKSNDHAVFDLFFRKNPFQGEFTIFAGLEECLKFLDNFRYSDSDIVYLQETLPNVQTEFFDFLRTLTPKEVTLYAIDEGSVVFPRVPLMRIEGPLAIVQILETTLLTLVNYASLVATNASRFRLAAGSNITLLEFGLRRAQGPDGGLSASKYAYMGGFDGTSNVLAGKLFNIPIRGTHAHAFITSFSSLEDLKFRSLNYKNKPKESIDFVQLTVLWRERVSKVLHVLPDQASEGELAALISYAIAFPDGFMALIDTYDVVSQEHIIGNASPPKRHTEEGILNDCCFDGRLIPSGIHARLNWSGMLNFCAVALALNDLGFKAKGVRIDSGDLAYLSNVAREAFCMIGEKFDVSWFQNLVIVASNDINEETIVSLNEQGHKIDCFGIGTHLVTCQKQPALGCVYKLVEVNGQPRIKLSQDVDKVTVPGRKNVFRLYGQDGHALLDLLQRTCEPAPEVGKRVLCRHPFFESKRAYVSPVKVESMYKEYWKEGKITQTLPSLEQVRQRVKDSLKALRNDHKRNLNPTPYKVSVTDSLYNFLHDLWLQNAPIGELC